VSFNLIVWKWSPEYDTAAKRRKRGVKYADITRAFMKAESHAAMIQHEFAEFESAIITELGPETDDGPYILQRYGCALVFDLPVPRKPRLDRSPHRREQRGPIAVLVKREIFCDIVVARARRQLFIW
jgi:hypothetical protein